MQNDAYLHHESLKAQQYSQCLARQTGPYPEGSSLRPVHRSGLKKTSWDLRKPGVRDRFCDGDNAGQHLGDVITVTIKV